MTSYQQFFAELKRRHVFKVAAIYGAVAFGLLQVADPLADAMNLPETFVPFVVALLLLGFPVALVLAWAFEMTPDGVHRVAAVPDEEIERIINAPASQRWPAGLMALVGVALLVGGAWWAGARSERARSAGDEGTTGERASVDTPRLAFVDPEEDPRPSIAVLPFVNMSAEADQEYFSDGITEELLNTLARIRELRVAARTSAFAFKGRDLDMRAIGDSLGVEYLVEGSVRKVGDQLRITAQLIDVRDGSHAWSDQYDRQLDDVFAIQTEIASSIAEQLRIPLGLDEGELLVSATADMAAYDLYLAGRARMRERGNGVFEARRLFEAAVARDTNWAPAWAGLAESLALIPFYAPGPGEPQVPADSAYWARSLGAAESAARRALALDPNNASATVALANVYRDRWEWEQAEDTYIRALSLDPDNVEAHQQYAEYLAYLGRAEEAVAAARRALALDRSGIRLNVIGYTLLMDGRYDEAIRHIQEGIALDPEGRLGWLRGNLLRAYVLEGRWLEARDLALSTIGNSDPALRRQIEAAWPMVDAAPSGFNADLLDATRFHDTAPEFWMALGRPQRALRSLLESFENVPPFAFSNVLFEPVFDPIRNDPQFEALLARRGLAGVEPVRSSRGSSVSP